MNRHRIDSPWAAAGMSLVLSLVLWVVVAWPLPSHFADGIPYSARTDPIDQVLVMKSGDHLQLLYHFWLAADMLGGGTPWFYNLYEFNTGDDRERFEPGAYYAPFSLIFAAVRLAAGDAAGWNAAGLVSIWLACFCTWLLARRYANSAWTAAAAAAVCVLAPYPWFALFGGSPTGFAVSLVPLTLLGIDLAVRDDRAGGGVLAGLGVLLAASADPHVFFFTGLVLPAWCLFALLAREDFRWTSPRAYARVALACLPAVVGGVLALGLAQFTAGALAESHIAGGRTWSEVALFSPNPAGFLSWRTSGDNPIYLGAVLWVVMPVGLLLLLASAVRDASLKRRALMGLLLGAGLAVVLLLALGVYGPFEGAFFRAARKLIPPYRMIRQPSKALCLAPVLSALTVALVLPVVARLFKGGRTTRALLPVLFVAAMAVELRAFLQPGICVLDDTQGAYAAVAEDAAGRDEDPRLLVVTLWPGDADYASVYQHYVRLYRIRMVNGYRPLIDPAYRQDVFERFESANLGLLDDGQLDALLERGIRYLAVHEDLFPEKVSPFPVAHTLANLEAHPRLTRIGADGAVRSYRIEAQGTGDEEGVKACAFYFPARRWEAEREQRDGGDTVNDNLASRGAFLALSAGDRVTARATAVMPAPRPRYLLRARGRGKLLLVEEIDGREVSETQVPVDEGEWGLLDVAAAPTEGYAVVTPILTCEEGEVDLDVVVLTAGASAEPVLIGSSIDLPAACFFHAGHTEPGAGTVYFRPDRDPGRDVLYGPKLPLGTGTYMVQFETAGVSPAAVPVGRIEVRWSNGDAGPEARVMSSGTAELVFEQAHNLPVFIVFRYNRGATVGVQRMTLSRIGL